MEEDAWPLPNNYAISLRRLEGLIKWLGQSPEILQEYSATLFETKLIRELLRWYQTLRPIEKWRYVHYLPHHAVIRHDKETTKLHVVYDALTRSSSPSLNDCLYTGPKFNQNIYADILLRFCSYWVALTIDIVKVFSTDIEKAFSINQKDHNALRFLWVDDIQKRAKIMTFRSPE